MQAKPTLGLMWSPRSFPLLFLLRSCWYLHGLFRLAYINTLPYTTLNTPTPPPQAHTPLDFNWLPPVHASTSTPPHLLQSSPKAASASASTVSSPFSTLVGNAVLVCVFFLCARVRSGTCAICGLVWGAGDVRWLDPQPQPQHNRLFERYTTQPSVVVVVVLSSIVPTNKSTQPTQ